MDDAIIVVGLAFAVAFILVARMQNKTFEKHLEASEKRRDEMRKKHWS